MGGSSVEMEWSSVEMEWSSGVVEWSSGVVEEVSEATNLVGKSHQFGRGFIAFGMKKTLCRASI